MEIPVIIFILLFVLVIVLILLHRSNKKYADKISVLEQTLNMKADAITSLKSTYAESKRAIDKHAAQENKIALQSQNIHHLKSNISMLEKNIIAKNKDIKEEQAKHVAGLQEHTKKIESMHQELRKKEQNSEQAKQKYETFIATMKNKEQGLQHTIESQQNKITELSTHMTRTLTHTKEVKQQLLDFKEQYHILQEDAKKNYAKYEKKLQEKVDENRALNQRHESSIASKDIEIKFLVLENEKKQKKIQNVSEKILRLEKHITEEQNKLIALEEKYEKAEHNHKAIMQNKLQEMEEVAKKLKMRSDEFSQAKEEIVLLEKKISVQSKEIREQENRLLTFTEKSEKEKKEYKKIIKEQLHVIEEEKEKLESLSNRYEKAKIQIISLEKTIVDKNNAHTRVMKANEALAQTLQEEKKSKELLKKHLASKADAYSKEKENAELLTKQIESLNQAHLLSIGRLESKQSALQVHINDLEHRNKSDVLMIEKLEENLKIAEQQYAMLMKQYDESEAFARKEKAFLENSLEKQSKTLKELENDFIMRKHEEQEKYTALETLYKEETEQNNKVTVAYNQNKKLMLEKNKEIEQLTQKLRNTKNNVLELEDSIQKKQQELLQQKHAQRHMDELNGMIVDKEKKLLQYQNQKNIFLEQDSIKHNKHMDILDQTLQTLENNVKVQDEHILGLESTQEENSAHVQHDNILHAIRKGRSIETIAKHFDIPLKRVELIKKFDKMQKQNKS